MLKRFALALALLAATCAPALAQSGCQWMRFGYVPTVEQWQSCWEEKQDIAASGLLTRVGDTDYAIQPTDRAIGTNVGLSALRTWTLPPASNVSAGDVILVTDIFGGVSAADPLVVAPNISAGNLLNQGTNGHALTTPFAWAEFISDGATDWTLIDVGVGPVLLAGGHSYTQPYDIAMFFSGVPTGSQLMLRYTATRPIYFAPDFGNVFGGTCEATSGVGFTGTGIVNVDQALAATPNTFNHIGTITFTGSVAVCATVSHLAQTMAQGDVLRITAPSTADATGADMSISIPGAR